MTDLTEMRNDFLSKVDWQAIPINFDDDQMDLMLSNI